jgi:hypothetical protein
VIRREVPRLLPWLLLASCSLPPLRGRVEIGKDPYGVFVGEGSGGSDLYAFHGETGETVALTFSPVREFGPVLTPDGAVVAFLRASAARDTAERRSTVWVMNLISGTERELRFPRGTDETPERVGWSMDGSRLYVETDRQVWMFPMPPGAAGVPVRPADRARADSALTVLLGLPVFARAEACAADLSSLCAITAAGVEQLLARAARDPARWGSDSVAFLSEGEVHIRPLGGGTTRVVKLTPARRVLSGLSCFPGRLTAR